MMFCACIPQHTLLFPRRRPALAEVSRVLVCVRNKRRRRLLVVLLSVLPPPCNLPRIAQEGAVVCVSVGGGEGGGMDGRALTREFSFHPPPLYVFPRPARASHSSLPLLTNMHREGGLFIHLLLLSSLLLRRILMTAAASIKSARLFSASLARSVAPKSSHTRALARRSSICTW